MTFTPAPNLLVEYRGNVGTIKFVSDEYLTFCMAPKDDKMIGSGTNTLWCSLYSYPDYIYQI